jgi:ring-1,2-phenylacetyl-CoA epoxidase subunit PaaC
VSGALDLESCRAERLTLTLRLGDDALVLGQRLADWCRNAPFLEEDLALANTALDFVGRARFLYGYAAELEGLGHGEDHFAYEREASEFSNLKLFELPRGDFAFTIARQYVFDEFDCLYQALMMSSADPQLAGVAGKAKKEADYHLRRSRHWLLRLGDGTEESHTRMATALEAVAPFALELFEMDPLEASLAAAGVCPDRCALQAPWRERVTVSLTEATLAWPENVTAASGSRRGEHTEHMGPLLAELQEVTRALPGLAW